MDGSALEEKSYFKKLGFSFSSKLDWCSYNISNSKIPFKKIRALICSIKFFSLEVALNLYKPELGNLVNLLYTPGRFPHCSNKLHDFSITFPRC